MKRIFILFFLLVCFFSCKSQTGQSLQFRQGTEQSENKTSWLNITDYGAIGDANKSNAEANTQAIKQCMAIATSNRQHSVVYIPSGFFWVNNIDNVDFRYVSFQGDGVRKSILKLNDNVNLPILKTNLWFECFIRDIQFDGNFQKNPDLEAVIHLYSPNVYAMYLDNVYVSYFANKGLFIDNGQLFHLNNIEAKYGAENGEGIYLKECLNVTINSPDCERNGKAGIVIESKASNSYRRYNPHIYIRNPYLERNPIGVHLKGVCRVSVEAGYNSGGLFAKIENSGDVYSHFNNFIGKPTGKILITKGNYGNYFTNTQGGAGTFIDEDGRNTGRLYNWDYNSKNLQGSQSFSKMSTNPADYTSKNVKNETEILSIENKSYLGKYSVLEDLKEIGVVQFKSTLASTSNSLFYYPNEKWKANSTYYFYMLADMHLNSQAQIRVYDMRNRQFLDWHTGKFQDASDSYKTQAFIPAFDGGIIGYQIPITIDDVEDRNLRVQLSIMSSEDEVESISQVYYIMVSEIKDSGMLHYRKGIKIAEGL